jgi:hypothetical protein
MLIMLAIPVIVAVAYMHRFIQEVAPSNVLARTVRSVRPRWRMAAGLFGLTGLMLLAMHAVAKTVSAGAPGWLNLVVFVLAWDAVKFAVLACLTSLRCVASAVRGPRPLQPAGPAVIRGTRTDAVRIDARARNSSHAW